MLYRELLIQELNNKRDDFRRFDDDQTDKLESYLSLLQELATKTSQQVRQRIGRNDEIGALPSADLDVLSNVSVKFGVQWQNHEQVRAWALETLRNRTTFAADGSQIAFEREITLPVAAIQVGTFENPHNAAENYKKHARITIVTPEDFAFFAEELEEPLRTSTVIGLKRFQAETEAVKEFLISKEGWQTRGERMPLAFFDGTLLISFSQPNSSLQRQYIETVRQIVLLSKTVQVPLVSYIAQSEARDLIGLLDAINTGFLHEKSKILNDAQLLSVETLNNWGDRTAFFYCNRKGLSEYFVDENDQQPLIGLTYLQTSGDALPARLDVPAWIFENGLLEEVLDTVRAESIVGLGYPYALETADATAVITMRDRESFLLALTEFSVRENLNFRVSNKKMSKARRR